jgi:ribosomal protein S18 acetylase RimI-like enzyme
MISMNIKSVKKEDKGHKLFNKREWHEANREHHGRVINFKSHSFVLEAREGDKIIGTLNCKITAGVAHIGTLIVAKNERNNGVGKQLVERAEKIAKSRKVHKIYLSTGEKWSAVKFYEAIEYKITGKLPKYYFKQDYVELSKFI